MVDEATNRRHVAWLRHCAAKARALADEYDASADRLEAQANSAAEIETTEDSP